MPAGRPRKGETPAEAAARRAGPNGAAPPLRPSTEPRRPRTPSKRKPTANQVEKVVVAATAVVQGVLCEQLVPALKPDALTAEELGLWGKAAAAEILSSKTLLAWYQKAMGAGLTGPHARTTATLMLIALPRLARHGLIPEEVAAPIFNIVATVLLSDEFQASEQSGPGAVPGEAGGAHPDHGSNGVGEVSLRAGAAGSAEVRDLLPVQGGRYPLVDGSEDDDFEVVPQRDG
jgi:hypothetical protein